MTIIKQHSNSCTLKPQNGALGIYAKSSSLAPSLNCDISLKKQKLRDQKFTLQNYIRALVLYDEGYSSKDVIPLDEYKNLHRVVKCVRSRVQPCVELKKESSTSRAFYKGLFTCGSVWACPVCSSKIQQVRREEVSQALDWANSNSLTPVMVTFTFPHYSFNDVDTLLKKQALAFKYFRSGSSFQKFKTSIGLEGFIRSLEITYGFNGWHPHTHELWFFDSSFTSQKEGAASLGGDAESYIRDRWEYACVKAGLIPRGKLKEFRKHSVDFRYSVTSGDYFNKQDDESNFWGLDSEMTLSSLKKGKSTIHPFELVQLSKNGDVSAGKKFVDYVYATKGKAQLFWSMGLKKKVLIEEKSDDEIASSESQESFSIGDLEVFAWQKILEKRARSYILTLAENGGFDAVESWLNDNGVNLVTALWYPRN